MISFRILEIKSEEISIVFDGKNVVMTGLDLDFSDPGKLIEQCSDEIVATVTVSKKLAQQAVAAFLRAE